MKRVVIADGQIWPTYDRDKMGSVFEYFQKGEGWKKTKKFKVFEVSDLPQKYESWIEVCGVAEKYGLNVAMYYADQLTAGIVAKQTLYGKFGAYLILKEKFTPEEFVPYFDILSRCEYFFSCMGIYCIDIVGIDNFLGKMDSGYDPENLTYKGETNVSMREYVAKKYGQKVEEMLNTLLDQTSYNDVINNHVPTFIQQIKATV